MECGQCHKKLSRKHNHIKCHMCKIEFHSLCVSLTNSEIQEYLKGNYVFTCEKCIENQANEYSSALSESDNDNENDNDNSEIANLKKSICVIGNELKTVRKSQDSISSSMNILSEKYSQVLKVVNILEDQGNKIKVLETENSILKTKLSVVESKIEDIETNNRNHNILLHGVSHKSNENIKDIINSFLAFLNLAVISEHMVKINRIRILCQFLQLSYHSTQFFIKIN